MEDGIPVNSATFTDEETWFELIGLLVEHSPSCMQLMDLLNLQAPNCAKGNDLLMKQMLKKSQMSSWIVLARIH